MIAKLVFGTEIHLYKGKMTLSNLRAHCFNVFKTLKDSGSFLEFAYID